jgi:hypothetical protein
VRRGGDQLNGISEHRRQAFLRRFPNREQLTRTALGGLFREVTSAPVEEASEALTLVSSELDVPIGLLRPTDLMADLLRPLHSGNPFRWVAEWTRAADGKSDRVVTPKAPNEGRFSLTSRARPPRISPLSPPDASPRAPPVADASTPACRAACS